MIFRIFSPKNCKKMAFLVQNTNAFCKNWFICRYEGNVEFLRKTLIVFAEKLANIAENSDHNIGPGAYAVVLASRRLSKNDAKE
jgi:hypothetical protein